MSASKRTTKARADALCKKLGEGWTPHLWENDGNWHYEAVKGVAEMAGHHPTAGEPYYLLFINSVYQLVGGADGSDPVAVLKEGLASAREKVAKMASDIAVLDGKGMPIPSEPKESATILQDFSKELRIEDRNVGVFADHETADLLDWLIAQLPKEGAQS